MMMQQHLYSMIFIYYIFALLPISKYFPIISFKLVIITFSILGMLNSSVICFIRILDDTHVGHSSELFVNIIMSHSHTCYTANRNQNTKTDNAQ